ncbi:MAG TPA: RAD55 family ATPase [Candidatus Bathyarchaeia archaeon]|nr:RAD55 family ATPase [Candidatus Bathyarchaeia archaeon]
MTSVERVSTGVMGLNQMLRGGIPTGSMVLVTGSPGSGKSTLGKQFLFDFLAKQRPAILVDTFEPLELAKETMISFEWDGGLLDRMIFFDCYSWRIGVVKEKYSANPANLTELSIALSDVLKNEIHHEARAKLVIDSFSDFLIHAGPEKAQKFLEAIKARLAERKVTSIVILEEGVHEDRVNAAIEYITDGTIKMRYEEKGRSLMVSRMLGTPTTIKWMPFTLSRGLEMAIANYFS